MGFWELSRTSLSKLCYTLAMTHTFYFMKMYPHCGLSLYFLPLVSGVLYWFVLPPQQVDGVLSLSGDSSSTDARGDPKGTQCRPRHPSLKQQNIHIHTALYEQKHCSHTHTHTHTHTFNQTHIVTQTSWYNVTSTAKQNTATSAERDWNKWQTVAVQCEKALASSPCYNWSHQNMNFTPSCGCALELTYLITIRSCCTSFIDISGPTQAVKSFLITLKSLPRYTFLQNIYNSKLLFCIFWDIKNSYIKEVIYCSLIVWYTEMLYELTSFEKY